MPAGYDSSSHAGYIGGLTWDAQQSLAAAMREGKSWEPSADAEVIERIGAHEKWLTREQVSDLLSISRHHTVSLLVANPEIGALRVGVGRTARWRIPRDGLMQWVMAQQAASRRPQAPEPAEQHESTVFRPGRDWNIW